MAAASAEAWAAAQLAYESGAATVSDIARALDCSHQAVSKHRREGQWMEPGSRAAAGVNPLDTLPPAPPPSVLSSASPMEVVARSADAVQASPPSSVDWVQRAPIEASAAGLTAAVIRQRLMVELRNNPYRDDQGIPRERGADPRMIRALAEAYKVFIQGAQLLTGEATDSMQVSLSPEDRQARLLQVLSTAAQRRTNAIEAAATAEEEGDDRDDAGH